ncbi:unnamed protein product [Clonostachys byssicola]|uniref:NmrA-like domain-containing protein n=1 Tax=Clonostachys byssicola TaxID=160290 RepID=A0A9N9Y0V2_9HYPO|nr:unnamed protein product [Clonostachys byssicola]
MGIIAVAGGTGDIGKLIVNALRSTGKHWVYSVSRKVLGPDGSLYSPTLVADYSDEDALKLMLESKSIQTVISALSVDVREASDAQVRLIRAAAATNCVRRFAPSEFNVDYDLPNTVLPYPSKEFHVNARRAVEQTRLEYTYFMCGMFMDYYGMPRVESVLKPTYSIIDLHHNMAYIPGDGQAIMATTLATDVARYVAAAVDLPTWPKSLAIAGSQLSTADLVKLAEQVKYPETIKTVVYPIEAYLNHSVPLLPSNNDIVSGFPGGETELLALLCDLDAAIALGAYDIVKREGCVDLVKLLGDSVIKPKTIEEFLHEVWGTKE